MENICSRIWTTTSCRRSPTALERFTTCWARDCSRWQGSNSTRGRPEHGTVREYHHEGLSSWGPKRGVGSASRSWEHKFATMSSPEVERRDHRERGALVESDRLSSRSPVRMASPSSMCWSQVSPLLEDITAQSVSVVCRTPR